MSSPKPAHIQSEAVPSQGRLKNSEQPNVARPKKFIRISPCFRQWQGNMRRLGETRGCLNLSGNIRDLWAFPSQLRVRFPMVLCAFTAWFLLQLMPARERFAVEIPHSFNRDRRQVSPCLRGSCLD